MRQVVLPGASASAHHCVTQGGPPVARSAHACRARHAAPAHVFTASRTPGSATRCPRVLPSSALSSAAFATLLPPSVGELLGNATFCATALAWVLAQTLKVRWWDIFRRYLCHLRSTGVHEIRQHTQLGRPRAGAQAAGSVCRFLTSRQLVSVRLGRHALLSHLACGRPRHQRSCAARRGQQPVCRVPRVCADCDVRPFPQSWHCPFTRSFSARSFIIAGMTRRAFAGTRASRRRC